MTPSTSHFPLKFICMPFMTKKCLLSHSKSYRPFSRSIYLLDVSSITSGTHKLIAHFHIDTAEYNAILLIRNELQ
jgi:hypothetical protein